MDNIARVLAMHEAGVDAGQELHASSARLLFQWSERHPDHRDRIDTLLARHQALVATPLTADEQRIYDFQAAAGILDPSNLRNVARGAARLRSAAPAAGATPEGHAEAVDERHEDDEHEKDDR